MNPLSEQLRKLLPNASENIMIAWQNIVFCCLEANPYDWAFNGITLITFEGANYMALNFKVYNDGGNLFKVPEELDQFVDPEFGILDYFYPDEASHQEAFII